MPGDHVDRVLVAVIIASSIVTLLTAGRTIRKWRNAAAAPARVEAPVAAPGVAAEERPVSAAFGSETSRRLLSSVPEGAELDDLRVFWPGPQFALRGRAVPGPETVTRLSLWETEFDGLMTPDGRPYQVWFRRLEGIEAAPRITFEFLLVPDGLAVSL
jgi:hypothetical protein